MKHYIDTKSKELNLLKEVIEFSKEISKLQNGEYFKTPPCKNCNMYCNSYSKDKDEKGEYVEVNKCIDNCVAMKKFMSKNP